MTPQVDGIILGIFSVLVSILLYWGGYAEQRRVNKEFAARRSAKRESTGDSMVSGATVRGEDARALPRA